jgi:hypothetical protein
MTTAEPNRWETWETLTVFLEQRGLTPTLASHDSMEISPVVRGARGPISQPVRLMRLDAKGTDWVVAIVVIGDDTLFSGHELAAYNMRLLAGALANFECRLVLRQPIRCPVDSELLSWSIDYLAQAAVWLRTRAMPQQHRLVVFDAYAD